MELLPPFCLVASAICALAPSANLLDVMQRLPILRQALLSYKQPIGTRNAFEASIKRAA
jgi:hypothetical protein